MFTHFIEVWGCEETTKHTDIMPIEFLQQYLDKTQETPPLKTIAVFKIKAK